MAGTEDSERWGTQQMLITVFSVLGSVAIGAVIVYLCMRRQPLLAGPRPLELQAASPNLEAKIDQIRAYIRTANKSESAAAGLSNASYALALLEDAEATYGAALRSACDPDKLRRLIKKVQDRHGTAMAA